MAVSVLKRSIWKDLRFIILIIILFPLWLWLYWWLSPKIKLNIAIIDKTVLNNRYQEHNSLFWILGHEKYAKRNGGFYEPDKNYYGFFPLDSNKYRIKGLERFDQSKLDQLVKDCDMAYVTDTYGIYTEEWNQLEVLGDRSSLIYGGLSKQDFSFLQGMHKAGKLIVTEFNTIGSPTAEPIRNEFEKEFGVKWSGWNGRYFSSFDTLKNPELPKWLFRNYQRDHNGEWPFKKDGIALVSKYDEIIVLERGDGLDQDVYAHIISTPSTQKHFGVPKDFKYNYWFDIMYADPLVNNVLSTFELPVNEKGKKLLSDYKVPFSFPAVIQSIDAKKPFYYLSGDFSDNPISMKTVQFGGTPLYKWMLIDYDDKLDRSVFFWNFYRPMVTAILKDGVKKH
jgi:hypothetical protein